MGKKLKYKDINLLTAQDRKLKIAKESKSVAIRLPVLILILVLVLLGWGYYSLYQQTSELEKKKSLIEQNLNDPIWIEDYSESLRLGDRAQIMVAQKEELQRVLLNLSSYPDMQGGDFHLIYEYAGKRVAISGVHYDRQTGVLSFNAECDAVTGVPIFVTQLRMSAIFDDVKYEGYAERVVTTTHQGQTTREWIPQLGPDDKPQLDSNGNEIGFWQENTSTYTKTTKTYVFAVTALVRAPEPRLPGSGEGVYGIFGSGDGSGGGGYGGGSSDNSGSGFNNGGGTSATK